MRSRMLGGISTLFAPEDSEVTEFARPAEEDYRQEATLLIAGLLIVLALILMEGLEQAPSASAGAIWLAVFVLGGSGLLTLGTLRQNTRLAGLAITGILLGLCLSESVLFVSSIPLFALPLVVMVAGASLGWVGGLASAGLGSGAMLLLTLVHRAPHDSAEVLAPLLFTLTAAVLVWLGGRPTQVALAWAWSSYSRMHEVTEELRRRQGELGEALKRINQAYYQLACLTEELDRARTAADEARFQKAQLAANLSHELRTPLNLIIGFSEMILFASRRDGEPAISQTHREDVEMIYRNAQHLSSLIEDVLDLGEIDAGRMGLHKELTHLREVVDESIDVVTTLFEDNALTLDTDIPENLPSVFLDRVRIRQVLINLLNNAARFTDQGGVRVLARIVDRDIVISVADTGIGIRASDLLSIFEEFRHLEPARPQRFGGRGLGLAICKKFVELHGGNIWAESGDSAGTGGGAVFSFSLPLAHNVASLPLRAAWETWARPPARLAGEETPVLVVSTDPGSTRLFQRHLEGFRILVADQLPQIADAAPVRAIIRVLDEHDEGSPLPKDLVVGGAQTPVIFCRLPSGRDLRQDLCVTDYLVKPFGREQLLTAVGRVAPPIETVLVVDDDPSMVALIRRTLLLYNPRLQIISATNGATALEILRGPIGRIDLLILDLLMPPPDGFAILEAIQAMPHLSSLPVIVVSARGFIDRGVTSSELTVTRQNGLSIRELMACTRTIIQMLNPSEPAEAWRSRENIGDPPAGRDQVPT